MPKSKKDVKKGSWGWKEKAILRDYRKMRGGKKSKNFLPNQSHPNDNNNKAAFFQRAMQEYERKKAIKEEHKKIKEAKRKEREEAIRRYTEKKRENFKKLSQKTKWGQPVMRGRMEILLEKIKKSVNNDPLK